jgi:hypothetical protein
MRGAHTTTECSSRRQEYGRAANQQSDVSHGTYSEVRDPKVANDYMPRLWVAASSIRGIRTIGLKKEGGLATALQIVPSDSPIRSELEVQLTEDAPADYVIQRRVGA